MLIDVHSHLDHPLIFKRVEELIKNAEKAGVKHIITNGIEPNTNRIWLELSKKYKIVECAMGIYPRSSLKKEAQEGYSNVSVDFEVDKEIKFIEKNKKQKENPFSLINAFFLTKSEEQEKYY